MNGFELFNNEVKTQPDAVTRTFSNIGVRPEEKISCKLHSQNGLNLYRIGTVTARNTKQWRKTQPCVPQWRTTILTAFFQLFLSALVKWQLWYGHPKSRLVWSGHHLYDQV